MDLTIEQAIEQGYIYSIEDGGERLIKLLDIRKDPAWYTDRNLLLCEKKPTHFQIGPDHIENLVSEDFDCQEEFAADDGLSVFALEGCDDLFKQLTERINKNMLQKDFYFNTQIKLTVEP